MNWLRKIRAEQGWTQEELAEKLDLSTSFLSDIENGRRQLSSVRLIQLAKSIGCTPFFLRFCQEKERGEFTLPMPQGRCGQEAARHLAEKWPRLTENQHRKLIATLTEEEGRQHEEG